MKYYTIFLRSLSNSSRVSHPCELLEMHTVDTASLQNASETLFYDFSKRNKFYYALTSLSALTLCVCITRNASQSPAVTRQAQRTHPGEDTPLQRSSRRVCCLRDVTCNEGVLFRAHRGGVVSAQRVFCPVVTLTFNL